MTQEEDRYWKWIVAEFVGELIFEKPDAQRVFDTYADARDFYRKRSGEAENPRRRILLARDDGTIVAGHEVAPAEEWANTCVGVADLRPLKRKPER